MTDRLINLPLAAWPIQLEYWHWGYGVAYAVAAALVVLLGVKSLSGMGPARQWVSIGARLVVLTLLFLIVLGIRWTRTHRDLELLVVRDRSGSTRQFTAFSGPSLDDAFKGYLKEMSARGRKPADDRIGEIVFNQAAVIESMLNKELVTDAAALHDTALDNQTDAASALELALATFRPDAMHRVLLVWDGNQTVGNVDAVVARAKSMNIPIDVMPLKYRVNNEVLMERFVGPTWKRENEPFTVEVFVRSTNIAETTGRLEVKLDDQPLAIGAKGETNRVVTLKPGLNRFPVTVPGLQAGVKRFKATFDGQDIQGGIVGGQSGPGGGAVAGGGGKSKADTLLENNTSEGFTVIKGKGKVLYVDNAVDDGGQRGPGALLAQALEAEGITLETIDVGRFPTDSVAMQNYDAVVLHNVPYGMGGLSPEQDRMLAAYVHDMGGGLVMIGGKDAFGAGGWTGTKTEEVLPVNMEIPAKREMPKGALVLVMHSCEMPNGNFWGEQCALYAIKALSDRDEVGVISYGWGNRGAGGIGGAQWDFPLNEKGDGSKVQAAIKQMQLGDMPSFDDALNLALNGTGPNAPSLKNSDARQKHVIIISDGDPQAPNAQLYADLAANQVSVSTITVFPHHIDAKSGVAPVMRELAEKLKGRYYGPIDKNPSQLPQIFIKEATVVRRSLIFEKDPLYVKIERSQSDLIKGLGTTPPIRGMVLTSRKNNPQIDVPLVAGENNDPVLAHWQAGLGRAVAFTADATNRWGSYWVASGSYAKFWAQVVRSVSRPPMSTDFDIRVTQDGNVGKITVEAMNKDAGFMNFLNVRGAVLGPDLKPVDVRLVQVGPGVYQGEFAVKDPGNYITMLNYTGAGSQRGYLLGGLANSTSPETRELQSNDNLLEQIAERTGGRVIPAFDTQAELFSRQNMPTASSPLPVWDVLMPFLLAALIVDVAVRRIAWDWASTKRMATSSANWVRSFTTVRKVEHAQQTLGSLKQVRTNVAEQKFKPSGGGDTGAATTSRGTGGGTTPEGRPDPKAKFEAKQTVSGDLSKVVGGASDKPLPAPPKKIQPKGQQPTEGNTMGGLMAAKRRAQDKIKEREQEE
jgi:uncharacterized membrane protein